MTIQQEIDKLERQLAHLKQLQIACAHDWGKEQYSPYTGKEERIIQGQYETHGIHMHPKSEMVSVTKQRWKRTCAKCGLTQYTETQRAVQAPVTRIPDFK